jgi:1,4-alpha-glucan branching enzyme
MTPRLGTNCLVLHGHLPWVHHPDHEGFLEEDWYLEALTDTYLPLLQMLQRLAEDGIPTRLTMGLTPPLLEMFRSPSLIQKSDVYLLRRIDLAEREVARLRGQGQLERTARHYLRTFQDLWETWVGAGRDLVRAFRDHLEAGRLEILASAATHPVLPLLHTEAGQRAQIRIGVSLFREVFGIEPSGLWLPECAYTQGLDALLVAEGVRFVVLESHGVKTARPQPRTGVYRPIRTAAGLTAFGRDPTSSRQVWAAEVGYPGDPEYRELYRDLGYDGPYRHIRPFLHKDGVRRNLGIKYHRVTGKVSLDHKELWDPEGARGRSRVHAGNYLWNRGEQAKHLGNELGEPVCIVSPYDMELFGHWWYEGPWFIEGIFRQMQDSEHRPPIRLVTPGEVLDDGGSFPHADPALSSWGEDGFLKVWLNEDNAWVLRHQHEIERRMIERAIEWPNPDPARHRLLDQMLRELLLLQASDWAFIITKKTQVHYARQRITGHVDRFLRMEAALPHPETLDEEWFATVSREDALFPGVDFRVVTGGPASLPGTHLGIPPFEL